MKLCKRWPLAFALALFGTSAMAADEAAPGADKALTCLGCHGIAGQMNAYPAYHVPRIGGQNEAYFVDALKAYKSGERTHKTMRAQAASLSEQDMQDLAAYFARFAPAQAVQR